MTREQYRAKYRNYLLSPKWQSIRKEIYRRDGGRCRLCGDKENVMDVHHTRYGGVVFREEFFMETLVLLCRSCHQREGERLGHVKPERPIPSIEELERELEDLFPSHF